MEYSHIFIYWMNTHFSLFASCTCKNMYLFTIHLKYIIIIIITYLLTYLFELSSVWFCRSEKVFECPDYYTSGNNSCFFDKAHTSIWIIYNITVMASNSYGSTFSEPVEVDVMDIGQFTFSVCVCMDWN